MGHNGNDEKTRKALQYVKDVPWPPRWGLGELFEKEKGGLGKVMILSLLYRKDKDIFRFSRYARAYMVAYMRIGRLH